MMFFDENKTPVSSECDCIAVYVENEDDYMMALETILGESGDFEVSFAGPGIYMPRDVMICGEYYFTLTRVSELARAYEDYIEDLEDEVYSYVGDLEELYEFEDFEQSMSCEAM